MAAPRREIDLRLNRREVAELRVIARSRTEAAARVTRARMLLAPKHGSWLNLVEGFFSKLARSVLRHIRVASKQELKDRLITAIKHINDNPIVHTWTYKLERAA